MLSGRPIFTLKSVLLRVFVGTLAYATNFLGPACPARNPIAICERTAPGMHMLRLHRRESTRLVEALLEQAASECYATSTNAFNKSLRGGEETD